MADPFVSLEEAADRAARNHGLDGGSFRRGDGSIYKDGGMNDGRVREAYEQIRQERVKAEQERQQKELMGQLGAARDAKVNEFEDSSRRKLASNMAGVKTAANSRGMLYSGQRQAGEVGAQAQHAGDVAGFRQQMNDQMSQAYQKITSGKADNALEAYRQDADSAATAFKEALARREQSKGLFGQIGGALGSIGGMLIGGPVGGKVGGTLGGLAGK